MVGWYRNMARTEFGCWYGSLVSASPSSPSSPATVRPLRTAQSVTHSQPLDPKRQAKKVQAINKKLQLLQVGWTAREVSKWNGRTPRELNGLAGLRRASRSKDLHQDML